MLGAHDGTGKYGCPCVAGFADSNKPLVTGSSFFLLGLGWALALRQGAGWLMDVAACHFKSLFKRSGCWPAMLVRSELVQGGSQPS